MTGELRSCAWPISRAVEALEALARASQFPVRAVETDSLPGCDGVDDVAAQTRRLESAAASLGIEVEAVEVAYADVDRLLRTATPALLRVAEGNTSLLLAVRAGHRGAVSVLTPAMTSRRLRLAAVRTAMLQPYEEPLAADASRLIEEAGVPFRRRTRAVRAILHEQLAATSISGGWVLRLSPGASPLAQGARAGVWSRLTLLAGAHASFYTLWILSWWIVGRAALEGHLDRGWLLAWALLLLTMIPLELLVTWLQGRVAFEGGALLKRRLLFGALRLEPEEIRREGAGHLLGRVLEAQATESLALGGGLNALVAVLELGMAAVVLVAAGAWFPILLAAWAGVSAVLAWRYFHQRGAWTQIRLAMTHDLIERIVGHRTRLAQQGSEAWHDGEDRVLQRYVAASRSMDRGLVWLMTVGPRGWLLAGVVALGPTFVSGGAPPEILAVAVGGVLLGFRAFRRLSSGLSSLAGAGISWREVAPIFHAAARSEPIGAPTDSGREVGARDATLLEAHELSFQYPGRREPVLTGASLRVNRGDRLLLHGPSGGGKSTFSSLLTGLRVQDGGLLLLEGVDRRTIGARQWRRRVVAAPQFHENHVFMGTFAFNALMGSEWPPQAEDIERAEAICRELGLGDLLERMPGGMLQQVGETGWQLSHGERSRLFIARALLQQADMVVLDESFAQLDPGNLQCVLACVLQRAPTIMVIAHP